MTTTMTTMKQTQVGCHLLVLVLLPLLVLQSVVNASGHAEWTYDDTMLSGPRYWVNSFPTCGASRQSPINIISSSARPLYTQPFAFTNYDRVAAYTLKNSGHSAQVSTNVKDITVTGGGLPGTYVLEQFHFHWGADSRTGSEHLVDSAAYSLEIHFVHYNSDRYADVASAVASGDPQALAVLGVFANAVDGAGSAELALIADSLAKVPHRDDATTLRPFAISSLLPCSSSTGDFYRYSGSLTTPGCAEVVIWTVFRQNICVSSDKLELFRELRSNAVNEPDEALEYNYRPAQPLNGRVVSRSLVPGIFR